MFANKNLAQIVLTYTPSISWCPGMENLPWSNTVRTEHWGQSCVCACVYLCVCVCFWLRSWPTSSSLRVGTWRGRTTNTWWTWPWSRPTRTPATASSPPSSWSSKSTSRYGHNKHTRKPTIDLLVHGLLYCVGHTDVTSPPVKRIIYYLNRQPIQFDLQVEGHDTISCFMSMRDVLAAKKSRSKCTQKTCARVLCQRVNSIWTKLMLCTLIHLAHS